MAKERIEQEAVPAAEVWKDALQRADRVLKQWPKGARVAASIGLIATVATASQARREGIIEFPITPPAEGKETTLEISATQIPPEIVVPSEVKTALEVPLEAEEESPPKTEAIVSFNLNYTIRPGDNLSEIAQRFGTTQDEILALNPEIKNPNLIHPGEELTIPEVSVEKTVEFLQDLEEKVEDIYGRRRMWVGGGEYRVEKGDTLWDIAQRIGRTPDEIFKLNFWKIENPDLIFPGQEFYLPESIYPSEATKEILTRVEDDIERLQTAVDTYGVDSSETRQIVKELSEYWNTAPGEKETVQEPKIDVDPVTGERGEWIASQIEEVFKVLPNPGRAVAEVFIISRDKWPDWPFSAGVYTYRDKGAQIFILEPRPPMFDFEEEKEWTREALLPIFAHEFGHAMSLRGEGYVLRFLTPTEVVDFVYEQTVLWDKYYRPSGEGEAVEGGEEEEQDAGKVARLFAGGEFEYLDPEIVKGFEEHFNRVFSKVLGYPITLDELAHRLKIR